MTPGRTSANFALALGALSLAPTVLVFYLASWFPALRTGFPPELFLLTLLAPAALVMGIVAFFRRARGSLAVRAGIGIVLGALTIAFIVWLGYKLKAPTL